MTGTPNFIRRHKTWFIFAMIIGLCLILILFSNRNLVVKPKEVGQSIFSVFQISIHRVSSWLSNTWNSIGELKKMRGQLEKAREKLLEYERVSRNLTELRRENEQLKTQLKFSKTLPFEQISGEVIARDPGNQFSTITVNKGSRHGVRKGMSVVAFQGGLQGLVGKVILVGLISSTIKPITDPTSYISARLQNSRYDGLVQGRQLNSDSLVMHYVRKLAVKDIQYGELVITSGMGQLFPRGIHIGRVREMQAKEYEASLELEVESIVDFSRLEYVFILDTGD